MPGKWSGLRLVRSKREGQLKLGERLGADVTKTETGVGRRGEGAKTQPHRRAESVVGVGEGLMVEKCPAIESARALPGIAA